jgi:hypothetical protein
LSVRITVERLDEPNNIRVLQAELIVRAVKREHKVSCHESRFSSKGGPSRNRLYQGADLSDHLTCRRQRGTILADSGR